MFKQLMSFTALALPSLVIIMNPFSVATVFLTLTTTHDEKTKRAIAKKACKTAFMVLLLFSLTGTLIFKVFSITIGAFQIAGGIVLFTVAMNMLRASPPLRLKQTSKEMREAMAKEDPSIVPLAIPMISGPGAITTVLVLASDAKGYGELPILLLCIIIPIIIVYQVLLHVPRVSKYLGTSFLSTLNRIMGLILAAVAVQFVINGIKATIPEIMKVMQ